MASIRSYQDLEIWQEGVELADQVYNATGNFPKEEQFGLTSQMRRAAVSVPSNIAEGQARHAKNDYRRFLYIGLGSLAELETLGIIAHKRRFVTDKQLQEVLVNPIASIRNKTLALVRRIS